MLTLAAAKGFWGCFSCALLRLHCSPPTISSGRGVSCSHCSLSWGGGSTGKTLWCISGWKLISSVSEVFRENTSMWDFFFFSERPISSRWTLLHPLSYLTAHRKPSATSTVPLQHVWCVNRSPRSPSCLGISKCSDYCGKEDLGKAPSAGLCAAQDESRLDGNVSWGLHRRKGRVNKQAGEQISHTYGLLLSPLFTCVCAYTVPLIPRSSSTVVAFF